MRGGGLSARVRTPLAAEKTDADPGSGNHGWRDLRALAAAPDAAAE